MHNNQDLRRARRHWRIDDIPFDLIEPSQATADPQLFYLLPSASFVGIPSDLYTQSLVSLLEKKS